MKHIPTHIYFSNRKNSLSAKRVNFYCWHNNFYYINILKVIFLLLFLKIIHICFKFEMVGWFVVVFCFYPSLITRLWARRVNAGEDEPRMFLFYYHYYFHAAFTIGLFASCVARREE